MPMPVFENVRVVLFDLDGTLLDSAPDLGAVANALRSAAGMEPLPLSHYRPYVGTGARGMLRIALGLEPSATNFDQLKEEFFSAYEGFLMQHARLFPGVPAVVQVLEQRGIQWGIVTNKSERFTLPITQIESTLSHAKVIISGDTTPHSKPHPEPLLQACRHLNVEVKDAIYVGDDERDMQAARAAGMKAIAAEYGYLGGAESVIAWNPDAVIKSPLELLDLLGLK